MLRHIKAILNFAFNYPEIDNTQIYVHGKSLGGAIAIYSVYSMGLNFPVNLFNFFLIIKR